MPSFFQTHCVKVTLFVMLMELLWPSHARAHMLGRSNSRLVIDEHGVSIVLDLDPDDFDASLRSRFDTDQSGQIDADERYRHETVIQSIVGSNIVVSRGGQACMRAADPSRPSTNVTTPTTSSIRAARTSIVRVTQSYHCPAHGPVTLALPLLAYLSQPHSHFLTVRNQEVDGRAEQSRNTTLVSTVLTHSQPAWSQADAVSVWRMLGRYFGLGVEHILLGYDHVLFLLGLVLAAQRVRELLAIVTAFTIAHSATLIGTALGVYNPPSQVIEPLIALSIAYVGLENIVVRQPRYRWALAMALGLVHGFGFAGALAETGIPTTHRLPALLAFNVGVEAGQVGLLAAVWPLLRWVQRRWPLWQSRLVYGGSAAIMVMGLVWFGTRTFAEVSDHNVIGDLERWLSEQKE